MLGPVLFTLNTTPLSAIISSFDINHNLYAHDTQIQMSLSVSNAKESLEKLQHCLMGVSAWMTGSKLQLNPSSLGPNFSENLFCITSHTQFLVKKQIHLHQPKILVWYSTVAGISDNTYPKHVGHASFISVTCVECEQVCP